MKAWFAVEDDEPKAVVGLAFRNGFVEVFSDVKPEFMDRKVTIFRWAKHAVQEAKDTGLQVFANLDPDIGSAELLKRLGFVQEREYWRLDG